MTDSVRNDHRVTPGGEPDDDVLAAIQRLVDTEAKAPTLTAGDEVPPAVSHITASGGIGPARQTESSERDTRDGQGGFTRRAIRWLGQSAARFLRRPDAPRWIATGLLAVVFLVTPGFVVFLAVLAVLCALVAYVTLGPDRSAELVASWFDRLQERDPDKAETLRRRAARVMRLVSAFADRLPDRWTTGLNLPDFEPSPVSPLNAGADPFDRLAAEVRAETPRD